MVGVEFTFLMFLTWEIKFDKILTYFTARKTFDFECVPSWSVIRKKFTVHFTTCEQNLTSISTHLLQVGSSIEKVLALVVVTASASPFRFLSFELFCCFCSHEAKHHEELVLRLVCELLRKLLGWWRRKTFYDFTQSTFCSSPARTFSD
jgi:hypothetical protein